jgi:DNA-directed RNA polymerase specialized sigma24 family protein
VGVTRRIDAGALFESAYQRLVKQLRPLAGDQAEDAASYAFVQLIEWDDRLELLELRGWLYTVGRNEAIRLVSRPRSAVLPELPVDDRRFELVDALDVLSRLRPQQRTALTCRMLGLTYREASAATGRTLTWLHRHVTEGRAAARAA